MQITKEWIDQVTPMHDCTSCNDLHTINGCGSWCGFDPNTGRPKIHLPRCSRCYLLDHCGEDTATLEFTPVVCVELHWNQKNSYNQNLPRNGY
jgi:hypothetical protein